MRLLCFWASLIDIPGPKKLLASFSCVCIDIAGGGGGGGVGSDVHVDMGGGGGGDPLPLPPYCRYTGMDGGGSTVEFPPSQRLSQEMKSEIWL